MMQPRSMAMRERSPGRRAEGGVARRIEVDNISYEYRSDIGAVLAVSRVTFSVAASQFLCILGPSGCGKSTILHMLAGFLIPSEGEIRIGGRPITGQGQDRGIVFQDFSQLFPWRTARRNVEFGLEMRHVPADERRETALHFLKLVQLEKFADAYPHQLSGGMQQRVAIARALAYNPEVLLMDEPFAALDAMTREDMQRQLTEVWEHTRKTVVYITHNVTEAVYLADEVLVLAARPGTVKARLTVDLARPRDPLGRDFVDMQREVFTHLTR